MDDKYYDALLHVKTSGGQKGFSPSVHYHRYEPTPYEGLDALFLHYQLKETDRVVDFGCGKGRLLFYIHHHFGASVVGIEIDKSLYHEAVENRVRYFKKSGYQKGEIEIHHCAAQDYKINSLDNRFYFFNPFSLQIFIKILNNILYSLEKNKRNVEIILYYPSDEYCLYLDNHPSFCMKQEIMLFKTRQSSRDKFLIYQAVEY